MDYVGGSPNYLITNPNTLKKLEVEEGTLLKMVGKNQGFRLMSSSSVVEGFAQISPTIAEELGIANGQTIELEEMGLETYTKIVRKKMANKPLSDKEIKSFMAAIDYGYVADPHIATFGTAVEINGMSTEETTSVAEAILQYSNKLKLKKEPIVDKHSIGGIAGNRITPIMVPIIAAAGLTIPKVSTRAITSPAGTSDALETVMPVELTLPEVTEVIETTNACMVDGLKIGLGDVADKFLRVVKQVKIDPKEMMIASILSKKKAAGSQYVLIDLPTGKGSKLPTRADARKLAYQFASLGNNLGLQIESVISPGDTPIGTMIGPALEMTEALMILEGKNGALNLRRKALSLAGLVFEMVNRAQPGTGIELASNILSSGKALEKFKQIVEAQGGDPSITSSDIPVADYQYTLKSESNDKIYSLDSFNIGLIARAAGAPNDKLAGVIIHKVRGETVHKGEPIITIHASSESKLTEAINMLHTSPPFTMEKMVLEHIKPTRVFEVD